MFSTLVKLMCRGLKRSSARFSRDERGIAATEFAVIVPIMLVVFFGTVEVTSAINVDRKVSIIARTLADLPSQSSDITSTDLQNFFTASGAILWPNDPAPINVTVSQIYIDTNKIARITWSKSATISRSSGQTSAALKISARNLNDIVTVDTALLTADTYLIWSEVNYKYVPAVGQVMGKAGVTLAGATYTRPRQSKCVKYTEGSSTFGSCS